MVRLLAIMTYIILGGCAHENIAIKVDNNDMSELGVVIIDYDGEHVNLSINGKSIFDEVVYSNRGGSGISASTVTMTTSNLSIEFCVNGECLQKELNRSAREIYLTIHRNGPIALYPLSLIHI